MTEPKKCPKCGTVLPPDAPGGHCPQCLLQLGLEIGKPDVIPISEKSGDWIGRYKLLQQIGEGGCGIVYMAEQDEPVRRRVALKIIKLGMDTKSVIARFEAERQALAMMDHPNIAKVFDAGATDTGRPYFVMELVRGIKITDYCDAKKLSIRQRLDLFIQVCQAIQHAHQKGIIHRDIKPSNVLVTEQDGAAVPKIIDFGIAKATTGQRLTDKTLFTAFEQFIGTPAYMSPEQAGLGGLDIDTRSDIYSLGVLLYELLTGHQPFDSAELHRAALDEVLRTLREKEPPRPSARLTTLTEQELTLTAERHQTAPAKLSGLLRGDLDWIVMKALDKDRRSRYETANGFAADIQRHLNNEPVTARSPGNLYRFQKMVRRNKLAVAAIGAVSAALIVGLGVSTWEFRREKQAREIAVAAEREQSRLREQAEEKSYAADMSLAGRSASTDSGLGNVQKLVSAWRDRKPDQRGWEWYYLNGLCHRDFLTIHGDSNGVLSVAWSPDGTRLASAGRDQTVKIWNAHTGEPLATLRGHDDDVNSVAWSPDSRRLASASMDETVKIWEADSSDALLTLRGHGGGATSVAWSPDGKRLASGSYDSMIKVWDTASGAGILTLPAPAEVQSVCWNGDGTRLAAATASTSLSEWDPVAGKELRQFTFERGSGRILSVAWSPDGKWLATGGDDSRIKTWEADGSTNPVVVGSQPGSVTSVAWNPDGTLLASASTSDGKIDIWDAKMHKAVQSFRGHLGAVRAVSWRPDGSQIASAGLDGLIKVWNLNGNDPSLIAFQQPDQIFSVAWSHDGSRLAASTRSEIWIWDTKHAAKPVILPVGQTKFVWKVAWNPGGTQLASADGDGILKVWDLASTTEIWSVPASTNSLRDVVWSPDGKRLATVGADPYLKVWNVAAKTQVAAFDLHAIGSFAVAWSPDGTQLAAAARTKILILDAQNGNERLMLAGHSEGIHSLAWSPDGKQLASASEDTTAKVWDAKTGAEIHTLVGHTMPLESVAWSPDGTRLATASADRTVKLWNTVNGMEVCSLADGNATQHLESVAWSPDGTRLASAGQGGNIIIRDSTPGLK